MQKGTKWGAYVQDFLCIHQQKLSAFVVEPKNATKWADILGRLDAAAIIRIRECPWCIKKNRLKNLKSSPNPLTMSVDNQTN